MSTVSAQWPQLAAIGLGGAIGSMLRFAVSNWVYAVFGRGFPYGTLIVNVLGCLAMGFLFIYTVERLALGAAWRAGILVGLLGGFTTFSAFSFESLDLLEHGAYVRAAVNMIGSVVLCLVATWAGIALGRQL